MAKRVTKYELILSDAQQRLTSAEELLARRRSEAVTAIGLIEKEEAVVNALRSAYDALEKSLRPQPRKASTKTAATASAPAPLPADKKVSDALCVAQVPTLDVPCGERQDSPVHDPKGGYTSYHEFEPPKPVARAPRKSRQKPPDFGSVQSSEIAKDVAGNAALGASASGD